MLCDNVFKIRAPKPLFQALKAAGLTACGLLAQSGRRGGPLAKYLRRAPAAPRRRAKQQKKSGEATPANAKKNARPPGAWPARKDGKSWVTSKTN
jgi:hypothetical protein